MLKPPTSRASSTRKKAGSSFSPGTGSSTLSRCARRSTTSTNRRSSPTLSSTTSSKTASSTPPLSYGITFKERKDIPVYNPEVRIFEVTDANGKPLALFYCDYFKRDNKQ